MRLFASFCTSGFDIQEITLVPFPKKGKLTVLSHNTVICVLRQLNIDNCNLIEDCEPEEFFTKEGKCLNKTKDNLIL